MVRIRVASTCGVIPVLKGNMRENGQPGPSGKTVGDRNNGASGVSWPSSGIKPIDGAGHCVQLGGQRDVRRGGWTGGDGWLDEWMDEWMAGWRGGRRTDGQTDRGGHGGVGGWRVEGGMVDGGQKHLSSLQTASGPQ